MKRTVELPPRSIQSRARSTAARTSLTPLRRRREHVEAASPTASASRRASVVLPTPGGPHRTIETSRPRSTMRRSAPRSPTSGSWPTNSARSRGRRRAARGSVVTASARERQRLRACVAACAAVAGLSILQSLVRARRVRRLPSRPPRSLTPCDAPRPPLPQGDPVPPQNLRIPGPTPLPDAVREAGRPQMINHRGPEFQELLVRASAGMRPWFGTAAGRPRS